MRGLKGFDKNLCCRGFQYEVGKTYEMEGLPILCERGFHFCKNMISVFPFYPPLYYGPYDDQFVEFYVEKSGNRYCEVEAIGLIAGDSSLPYGKFATNKIKILRELSSKEVVELVQEDSMYFFNDVELTALLKTEEDK